MDVGMYKRITIANDCPFKWNANLVFFLKSGQEQLRLTFNNHFIYENLLASHIEAATNIYNLLDI